MSGLKLYFLGPPQVELEGMPVAIKRRKALALLVYLAITGIRQRRDTLAALLWPDSAQRGARKGLRRDLSELNLALDGKWFEADRESVGLRAGFWLDVTQFQRYLAEEEADLASLITATELYRDDFLTGFTLPDCPVFDEWQFFQSESLRQSFATALERLVDFVSDQADHEAAIPYARRWLALDPLHEAAHRRLMLLHAQTGQQAAALRQYEICCQTLENELGISPAQETTLLYDSIRTGKLKNTDLFTSAFLHPRSPAPLRHNLPTQTTTFIGRDDELTDIKQLLLDESGCRLLNLVGPGGVGKTRLALAAAAQALDAFPDGVYFVSLAPVGEVDDIVPTIAEALRFTFYGSAEPKDQLLDYLSRKQLLLVVDNFEHLLDEADLLSDILSQAPEVTLLATSRERLHLQEEWVYAVQGLAFPAEKEQATEILMSYSAVELFTQRARQMDPKFGPSTAEMAHIERICQLVEGMPLALELAAPWIRTLSCREIAMEIQRSLDFLTTTLHNVPARHRSLQAVFDRSWQLLNPEEQRVFASCSVFRGSFTRASFIRVTGTTLPTLAALADKSLLHREATGRYVIHELTRQFAQKKLQSFTASAVQAIYKKHAYYFLHLIRAQELAFFGSEPQHAVDIIQTDLENVHTAWNWACIHNQMDLLNVVLEPLARFYKMASLVHIGEQVFAAAAKQVEPSSLSGEQRRLFLGEIPYYQAEMLYLLARYQEAGKIANAVYAIGLAERDPTLQAQAQILLGQIAFKQGQNEKARQYFEQGHALCLQVDNDRLLAHALDNLGNILHILKEQDYGLAYHQQACQIAREQEDRWALATYLSNLGWMYYDKWEFKVALDYFQQALTLQQQLNVRYDMIETYLRIGQTYHFLHEDEQALHQYHQAVRITEELGLKDNSQAALAIGNSYRRKGDWDRALWWLEKARQLLAELGKSAMLAECTASMGFIFTGRGDYDLACLRHQEALDIYVQLNMLPAAGHQHCHLGVVYYRMGNYQGAQKHLGKALALARALDDRPFLPQILQESAELAFHMGEHAAARAYCEECLQMVRNGGTQQHFFRQSAVTLGVNILLAKLTYMHGNSEQAFQRLKSMLDATESLVEQATLYYARWQLDQDPESRRRALARYQQLYAREPYFHHRQRIDELTVRNDL